jgi:hypothetical protein
MRVRVRIYRPINRHHPVGRENLVGPDEPIRLTLRGLIRALRLGVRVETKL